MTIHPNGAGQVSSSGVLITIEEERELESKVQTVACKVLEKTSSECLKPATLTAERVSLIKERAQIHPLLARAIGAGGISPFNDDPRIKKEHLKTKYNVDTGGPTDQAHSGRCWIFSGLNYMRNFRLKDYGKDFEYSQSFVAFWDKMERANHFLEKMVGMADLDVSSFKVQTVLDKMFTDGGEWELFANVVEKYGVVPKAAMPETRFSGNSGGYMSILKKRLREVGGVLHMKMKELEGVDPSERQVLLEQISSIKDQAMTEVYSVLVGYLGEPPSEFLWQPPKEKVEGMKKEVVEAKEKEAGKSEEAEEKAVEEPRPYIRMTPLEFYRQSQFSIGDKVHLTHLPYHPEGKKIIAQDIGNVEEGARLQSLNVSMENLKAAIRASIKAGEAVEIACEMRELDRNKRLLSSENDMTAEIFGFDRSVSLEKGLELQYQVTSIAHGMVLVGCDDPETTRYEGEGKPPASLGPLWKVENSWKDNQFLFMTDEWFNKNCYGIVVDQKYLPDSVKEVYDREEEAIQLNAWDPFCKI